MDVAWRVHRKARTLLAPAPGASQEAAAGPAGRVSWACSVSVSLATTGSQPSSSPLRQPPGLSQLCSAVLTGHDGATARGSTAAVTPGHAVSAAGSVPTICCGPAFSRHNPEALHALVFMCHA